MYHDPANNFPTDSDSPQPLSYHQRFIKWKFLDDLCRYGPSHFAQFCDKLSRPEVIEAIPVTKTPITLAWSMEFSNSTVAGNISAIKNLIMQGGVGDPEDTEIAYKVVDCTLYLILFHGDLGTGDRILSIQLRRSVEATPWDRFQFIIFVPGLFHIKMACADVLRPLQLR